MKRNYSGKILIPFLLVLFIFSCKEKTATRPASDAHVHSEVSKYTCPMHPAIVRDKPGTCPICGMDLVPMSNSHELIIDSTLIPLLKPVNQRIISAVPTIRAENETRIHSVQVQGIIAYDTRKQASISSRVSGRIEKMLIKYNFQPVRKGQLIMEVYSPDLAVAQRELIYISRTDPEGLLLQRAKQRLSLLGMQPAQIEQVLKTGKPLYRVPIYSNVNGYIVDQNTLRNKPLSDANAAMATPQSTAAQTPVVIREGQYVAAGETIYTIYEADNMVAEFSVPPSLTAEIKTGQRLVFHTVSNSKDIKTGTIGLIEPTQRNDESFTLVRVYLANTTLQPGQLLTANIPIVETAGTWLPENSVLQLGRKSVVFRKENNVFTPEEVRTGIHANGWVQIIDSIFDWSIAANAGYMIDSESFIRIKSNDSK